MQAHFRELNNNKNNKKIVLLKKILFVLTMEITSAHLDFPRVSKIIAAVISSIFLNSDTSRKAQIALQCLMRKQRHSLTNPWVSARALKQGNQYKSQHKPTPLEFHSQGKPGWVLAANNLSGISIVTSSHPIKKIICMSGPAAGRSPKVSCGANSSAS